MEVQVTFEAVLDSRKDLFLSNPRNKEKFIKLVSDRLRDEGIMTINCEGDADTEIVQAALALSTEDNVTVLADDADITVLLIHGIQEVEQSTGDRTKIYKDRVGKVYDISAVARNIPRELQRAVLLIHAFMGCDTTSSIFNYGQDRLPTSSSCDVFMNLVRRYQK